MSPSDPDEKALGGSRKSPVFRKSARARWRIKRGVLCGGSGDSVSDQEAKEVPIIRLSHPDGIKTMIRLWLQ
jgi:hypothetical protein